MGDFVQLMDWNFVVSPEEYDSCVCNLFHEGGMSVGSVASGLSRTTSRSLREYDRPHSREHVYVNSLLSARDARPRSSYEVKSSMLSTGRNSVPRRVYGSSV